MHEQGVGDGNLEMKRELKSAVNSWLGQRVVEHGLPSSAQRELLLLIALLIAYMSGMDMGIMNKPGSS